MWRHFDEHLAPRPACKLMVGCLALAAEFDTSTSSVHRCESDLAEYLLQQIQADQIPDLLDLQRRFGKTPPTPPTQHVSQHTPASYDILLNGKAQQEVSHAAC